MTRLLAIAATMLLLAVSTGTQAASFASQSQSAKLADGRTLSDYNIQKES